MEGRKTAVGEIKERRERLKLASSPCLVKALRLVLVQIRIGINGRMPLRQDSADMVSFEKMQVVRSKECPGGGWNVFFRE